MGLGERCNDRASTYPAVVSGDACPISSRNTSKSIPAEANWVPQVCRSRCGRTRGVPACAVGAEDLAHPGLGHRLATGQAAQYDEAFAGAAAGWAFAAQIDCQLGEERRIHRDGAPCRPCPPPEPGAARDRHRRAAARAPPAAHPTASAAPSPGPVPLPGRRRSPRLRAHSATPAAASPPAPTGPRHGRAAPAPNDRACRAEPPAPRSSAPQPGTGFCVHNPATTAYSNKPRTAAIRRFTVAAAAPARLESFTTTDDCAQPLGCRCQSR
jgi:hypothetical protein